MAVAGQLEQGCGQADEGEEKTDGQKHPGQGGRPFRVAMAGQIGEGEEIARIGVAGGRAILELDAGAITSPG